ncbi:MAG TPA: hypothetical protein VM510_08910 [Caulifigura sp.]|jgi:hypothetical protein|nr:hypothetical protein [Caulifigura sp.]
MGLTAGLDIVEELRLRRWARENYAAAEDRSVDWHPIILDEMERRDAEVARLVAPPMIAPRFYPNRRLDGVYGPHEIRPHYEPDAMVQREMHYT